MCCDMNLMFYIKTVKDVRPVTLTNGSVKIVKHVGSIKLSENFGSQ